MAESTPVLIAVADETSNATYFNKAWIELTGRPMEELLQYGWVDLVHPEEKEQFVNIYLDAFAIKGPFTGEFRVRNTGGEYRWLLAHGAPRFDTDGNFKGYISACTDITEQKTGQQQLQTALEQVRLSKEAAELGTLTWIWSGERCIGMTGAAPCLASAITILLLMKGILQEDFTLMTGSGFKSNRSIVYQIHI
jgi:PAS domain S-box-containing protein